MSYFLWSSIPDDELRQAAAAGRLHDPEALADQARRMLGDPKARRFAAEFFGQWFGFYRFDKYRGVDGARFPEFNDSLKQAMYDEAVSFFEYIVREDRPPGEMLFADYLFVDAQLARHYGLPANDAARLAKVDATGQYHRGGLLRLGAVLTVTSAPLRTSPVKRGDWISAARARNSRSPAAGRCRIDRGRRRTSRRPFAAPAAGRPSPQCDLRELPRANRPAGLRAGEL